MTPDFYNTSDEGVVRLCKAMITQAVKDYKLGVYLKKIDKSHYGDLLYNNAKRFFLSEWFTVISCGLDGKAVFDSLERRYNKK